MRQHSTHVQAQLGFFFTVNVCVHKITSIPFSLWYSLDIVYSKIVLLNIWLYNKPNSYIISLQMLSQITLNAPC